MQQITPNRALRLFPPKRLSTATLVAVALFPWGSLDTAHAETGSNSTLVAQDQQDMGTRSVSHEITLSAPPAEVWALLTTAEGTRQFFGEDARIELRVGGPYEIYFSMDAPEGQRGSEGCHVLTFVPNEVLSFEWNAPPSFAELRDVKRWVVIQLEPIDGNRTHLTLTDLGFGEGPQWEEVRRYFERAWNIVLTRLEQRIATGKALW
jgi:uncharacterized protein YndB with AHSA1/START domain